VESQIDVIQSEKMELHDLKQSPEQPMNANGSTFLSKIKWLLIVIGGSLAAFALGALMQDHLKPDAWSDQRWWLVYSGGIGALLAVALCVHHILVSLGGRERAARNWAVLFGIALTAIAFGIVLQLYVLPASWPLWQLWVVYLGSFSSLVLIVVFFEEFVDVLQKVHFWKILLWAILYFGPAFIFIKADDFLVHAEGLAGMAARLLAFAVDDESGRGAVWWLLYSLLWTVAACALYFFSLLVRWIIKAVLVPLCLQIRLWLRDRMRHNRMLASIEKKREKAILEEFGGDPSRRYCNGLSRLGWRSFLRSSLFTFGRVFSVWRGYTVGKGWQTQSL